MGLLTDAYIVTGKEKILRKRKIVHYNGPSTINSHCKRMESLARTTNVAFCSGYNE
jgi:hypothetical protein